jgi:thiamine biosynthesis lipoprotein
MRLQRLAFQAMASPCEVMLWGDRDATAALAAAAAEVRRIEGKYSRFRDDSVVSAINRAAGANAVDVDAETAALIGFAAALHADSGGLFDLTSGVLRRAWRFKEPRLPAEEDIAALLPLIGWERVAWNPPSLRLPVAGMELDFGGFGKEYAADRAAAVLHERGERHALVNLGGDVRLLDAPPDGSPWRIAIQHPRRDDVALARIELRDGALATSGDYERFIEVDGRRYCHALDPRTGWPVECPRSVSVVAPLCAVAGAHATIALLKGDGGRDYLDSLGLCYLLVDRAGVVSGTLSPTL